MTLQELVNYLQNVIDNNPLAGPAQLMAVVIEAVNPDTGEQIPMQPRIPGPSQN